MRQALKKLAAGAVSSFLAVAALWLLGEVAFRATARRGPPPPNPYLLDRSDRWISPQKGRRHQAVAGVTHPAVVVVIGDSFTVGDGVLQDDRYAARLERWLNFRTNATPVRVDVFAGCGSSTYQQLGFLRDGLRQSPRLVLLTLCLNDTEDHERGEELRRWRARKLPRAPEGFAGFLARHSLFFEWIWRRADVYRQRDGFLLYYRRLYRPTYSGWSRFADAAAEFSAVCATNRVPLAVAIFPLLSHDLREGRYPFTACHRALRDEWAKHGVPVLDLYDAFKNLSPTRLQVIPGVDPHPNEIAHRVAAEAIMNFLFARQLLPPGCQPPPGHSGKLAAWKQIERRGRIQREQPAAPEDEEEEAPGGR